MNTYAVLAVLCWMAATFVTAVVVGGILRRLARRDTLAEIDLAHEFSDHIDADGVPTPRTAPPGRPEPCFRCDSPAECGAVVTVCHPATRRVVTGVLCQDCYRMMWLDNARFAGPFCRRAGEEFGGRD